MQYLGFKPEVGTWERPAGGQSFPQVGPLGNGGIVSPITAGRSRSEELPTRLRLLMYAIRSAERPSNAAGERLDRF